MIVVDSSAVPWETTVMMMRMRHARHTKNGFSSSPTRAQNLMVVRTIEDVLGALPREFANNRVHCRL